MLFCTEPNPMIKNLRDDLHVDIAECIIIQTKLKKAFWRLIKRPVKRCLILVLCLIIFSNVVLSIPKNLILINIFGICCFFVLFNIVTISVSIDKCKERLFERISKLLLKQFSECKINAGNSKDFYEDFLSRGKNDFFAKIRSAFLREDIYKKVHLPFIRDCISIDMDNERYFSFTYNKTEMQIVNTAIKATILSRSFMLPLTLFQGIIIAINTKSLLQGNTCILQNKKLKIKQLQYKKLPLINIEIPLLKNHNVYSNNNNNLNKILEPTFLQSLMDLKVVFNGRSIEFGANGKNMVILIKSRKTSFGYVPLFKELQSENLYKIYAQYNALFNFITTL